MNIGDVGLCQLSVPLFYLDAYLNFVNIRNKPRTKKERRNDNQIRRGKLWELGKEWRRKLDARRTDHDQRHCYHHVPTVNQRRLLQFISS